MNNNFGNYEPSNCHWGTKMEQSNNRSNNIFIEGLNGIKVTLAQAARDNGLKYVTLQYRLKKGMAVTEALTTPLDKTKQGRLGKS